MESAFNTSLNRLQPPGIAGNIGVHGKSRTTGLAPLPLGSNTIARTTRGSPTCYGKKGRRSDNVVDARGDAVGGGGGMRFGGGKGLSLTAIILIVGVGWLTGQDPMQILGN